nr:MAG TPA: hypothetical protein [Caudoviricetes sp.]
MRFINSTHCIPHFLYSSIKSNTSHKALYLPSSKSFILRFTVSFSKSSISCSIFNS